MFLGEFFKHNKHKTKMIKSKMMLFVLVICLSISLRIEGACDSVPCDSFSERKHQIILFLNTSKALLTDYFPAQQKQLLNVQLMTIANQVTSSVYN